MTLPISRARLSWSLFALAYLCLATGFVLLVLGWSAPLPESTWGFRGFMGIVAAMFTNMGTVLSLRRPDHRIGWLFLFIGLGAAAQFTSGEYAIYGTLVRPGALPAAALTAWLASWLWVPMMGLFFFMCLLFPDGHLPARGWRVPAWLIFAWSVSYSLVLMFTPGPLMNYTFITNPLGIPEAGPALAALSGLIYIFSLVVVLLAVSSLFARFRRASGVQREQLKWFMYAVTVAGMALLVSNVFDLKLFQYLAIVSIFAVPPAVGLSILRYRLFDIDRVINRTIVYTVLSALLALLYISSVLLLRTFFRTLTGEQPEVVTVVSTLLIASLFVPLRGRVQTSIDRRLYRRKYNASKTLEAFAALARDEVDLDRLRLELVQAVEETVQPTHVWLWLRPQFVQRRSADAEGERP